MPLNVSLAKEVFRWNHTYLEYSSLQIMLVVHKLKPTYKDISQLLSPIVRD